MFTFFCPCAILRFPQSAMSPESNWHRCFGSMKLLKEKVAINGKVRNTPERELHADNPLHHKRKSRDKGIIPNTELTVPSSQRFFVSPNQAIQ